MGVDRCGERALIALGWAEPRVMVNIQGLPVALALLCVALVGCQSLERPFDDGKEWECTSSERFGEEGMFVKRRFMVLA